MINLKTLTTIVILAFSSVMPAMVFAQPSEVSADDWVYVNGNSWGWNHSPQSQISTENVDELEVKWIFPLEGVSAAITYAAIAVAVIAIIAAAVLATRKS